MLPYSYYIPHIDLYILFYYNLYRPKLINEEKLSLTKETDIQTLRISSLPEAK